MGGGGARIAALYKSQKGVLQKVPRRHGRETARFGNGQEIDVLVKHIEKERHFGFVPGRTPPGETLSLMQNALRAGMAFVQQDPSLPDSCAPFPGGGVGIFSGQVKIEFGLLLR